MLLKVCGLAGNTGKCKHDSLEWTSHLRESEI